eukprot:13205201-Ditylum_brightwellii.AAC.1
MFEGWRAAKTVLTARHLCATSNLVCRYVKTNHVSARDLTSLNAPKLTKHILLNKNDKRIWDKSYKSEYYGLEKLNTWSIISKREYQVMRHITGPAQPTMAILCVKYDPDGNQVRAMYRIVALGNLDTNPWSKANCFTPVLSQMELRLLLSIAVKNKVIPQIGDVSQAFCQSYLPPEEKYVLQPPPGCFLTPKDHYLLLQKTLYGLKRSPRHWYELAKKTLLTIGLKQK